MYVFIEALIKFHKNEIIDTLKAIEIFIKEERNLNDVNLFLIHLISKYLKQEHSILFCDRCFENPHHSICAYFNGNQQKILINENSCNYKNFLSKKPNQYTIHSFCHNCSNINGYPIKQIQYLRRFPINIKFIKEKLSFHKYSQESKYKKFELE